MKTAEISYHGPGVMDGSGRPRSAEWRLWVPGHPTHGFPCDHRDDADKRRAHGAAMDCAARLLGDAV